MSGLLSYLPFMGKTEEEKPLPPVGPTDEVIPVHLFDDSAAARGIVLVWTFRFEDVLDPEKLNDSLSALFQKEGWRRFSGRFRYRPDGSLEIHVPSKITASRPAVTFSKQHHEIPMTEHPLASRLPRPNGRVTLYPGPKEFCPLGLGPDTPRNMDDYVFSGSPQFSLHVQTFTDGSLVSITHSHVSTDLMGLSSIFSAWSSILAGREQDVSPLIGYHDDAFDALWNPPPKETHVLADQVLSGWRFKYWGLRSLYEAWRYADVESRTLCIPEHTMAKIMTHARDHLMDPTKFITEGDVLTAVACRMLAKYQNGSSREMGTVMAVDPRSRVLSVFKPSAAYVQNSPTNVYHFCRADEVLGMPLGQAALRVRESISTQTTEGQLKAAAALSVEAMKTSKMPVIFGSKDMATQFMSNWTKGDLAAKMDFGPAVVKGEGRGRPVYYQASDPGHNTVSVISSVFVVVARDAEGNRWLSVSVPKAMWADLMAFLNSFA